MSHQECEVYTLQQGNRADVTFPTVGWLQIARANYSLISPLSPSTPSFLFSWTVSSLSLSLWCVQSDTEFWDKMQAEWEELARRNWLTENEQAQIPSTVSPYEKVTIIKMLLSARTQICPDDSDAGICRTVCAPRVKVYHFSMCSMFTSDIYKNPKSNIVLSAFVDQHLQYLSCLLSPTLI